MRVCDSLCLGGWKAVAGGGPEPRPGEIFQPCRQVGPKPDKGSGESHCQEAGTDVLQAEWDNDNRVMALGSSCLPRLRWTHKYGC